MQLKYTYISMNHFIILNHTLRKQTEVISTYFYSINLKIQNQTHRPSQIMIQVLKKISYTAFMTHPYILYYKLFGFLLALYNKNLMIKKSNVYQIICLILAIMAVHSSPCIRGQVFLHDKCHSCLQLAHTTQSSMHAAQNDNSCFCVTGFHWSQEDTRCIQSSNLRRDSDFTIKTQILNQEEISESPRLLIITCDASKGFILKNNICVNCRDIPYSNGYAVNTNQCFCTYPYSWWSYFQICGCYQEGANSLYNNGSACSVCSIISDSTSSSQCLSCNGGPFGYAYLGCINCSSIPYATGATASTTGGSGVCTCLKGYSFNYAVSACICSRSQWYGILTNGSCVACSSLSTPSSSALYLACATCKSPFYFNGYVCLQSSTIGNLNTVTNTCPTNFVLTTNPVTNQTLRCVCSFIAGYYTNGNSCQSCTTQPIPGIAATNCLSCDVTSGFYLATKECIYCLNAPYTTGVAMGSGCQCIINYFWSSITSSCQCDWTIGYYGTAGSCINCYQLSNTVSAIATGCICIVGYKWNGSQCICDTANGAYFLATQCINCNTMIGAIAMVVGGNSCGCITGFIWNSTLGYCVCDINQNFYIINGICSDCTSLPNNNGPATQSGCGCISTLTWIINLSICGCPSGYVNMGSYCGNCALITLPTGATVAGCQACNNSQGFYLSGGICYACSKQQYTSNIATSTGCGCLNSTLIWAANLNSCVCSFYYNGVITTVVNGKLSCMTCSGLTCSCGYSGTGTIYNNGLCISCASIPYTTGVVYYGTCLCLAGYAWTTKVYPFQCYCSAKLGYYLSTTCNSCSLLSTTGTLTSSGCQMCSYTEGFLKLANDTCILCSSLPNTNGLATINGCGCTTGFWDPALLKCSTITCLAGYIFSSQNQVCICNTNTSIIYGSNCIPCTTINYSTGLTLNSTTCICITNYTWKVSSSGVGSCTPACDATTSVMIDNLCFNCLTVQFSTGPILGTNSCQCPIALSWSFTTATSLGSCICANPLQIPSSDGSSCLCNPIYAINLVTTNDCFDCRTVIYSSNSTVAGSCGCLTNFIWNGILQACLCPTPFAINGGQCFCNLTAGFQMGSNCFNCLSVQYSTGSVLGTNDCQCPTALIWVYTASTNSGACICQDSLKIPSVDGSSCICNPSYAVSVDAAGCFDCRTVQYSTNSTVSNACGCLANFVWDSVSQSCVCPSTFVVNEGQCICNLTSSVLIGSVCLNCLTVEFSVGPISGTSNCQCPAALTWVYTTSTNSGVCVCQNPLQIPSSDGSSCLCNSAYAVQSNTPSINICLDCRTVEYSTNSTVLGSCGCQNNFVWNGNTQTCQCLFPDKISGGQCLCDLSISVLIGNLCLNCLTVTFSTGPVTGTSNCQCPTALVWVYTASTNSGACICQDSLKIPSVDGSSCICNPTYAVLVDAFGCLDCRTVQYSTNQTVSNACGCLANFVWNSVNQSCVCIAPYIINGEQCICDPLSTVLINGQCFVCSTDPFSTGISSGSACICTYPMIWDGTSCVCNNTSAYIAGVTNSSWQCVDCTDTTTFTLARISQTTCSCINSDLVWNSLGYCDCGYNKAMIIASIDSYVCIICDWSIYSTGQSNSYACACPSPLTWNPVTLTCDCGTSAVVIVLNPGVYSCLVCNSTIYATNVANTVTCNCINSQFIWQPNYGCVCSNPQSVAIGIDLSATCVICNAQIYSTGKDPTSNNCLCQNNLIWTNGSCKCKANFALLPNISCILCGSLVGASGLLNTTTCICISNYLTWLPNKAICGCTDNNCIFIGASTYKQCYNCSNTVYATTPNTSTTCNCMSSNLTWNNTSKGCDCGLNNAFYLSGSNFICVDCTNPSFFTLSRRTSTSCNCLSSALVWSSITGACECKSSSAVIFVSGNSFLCITCNTAIFAASRLSSQVCNCLGNVLTWSSISGSCTCNSSSVVYVAGNYSCITCSSSVYALNKLNATTCNCIDASFKWTGNSCNCSIGSIILPSFKCLACTTLTTLSNFTCSCSTTSSPNSIWNDITQTCVTCGSTAIPNSVAGYYGVACACVTGYIWDVMTNACISNCPSTGCTMNCASISNVASTTAILASSITARNLPGGINIKNFYSTAGSNYANISSMACQCNTGYSWDSVRLRCYSNNISLQ